MVERDNVDIAPLPVFTAPSERALSIQVTRSCWLDNSCAGQCRYSSSPGVYWSSRADHYQLKSPGPVKYRPALIETISPDKSEWPTNICNIKYKLIEHLQPPNYDNETPHTHSNTFLHPHHCDVLQDSLLCNARHVNLLRYPRGFVTMSCAPIRTQRSSLLTNRSASLIHATNPPKRLDSVLTLHRSIDIQSMIWLSLCSLLIRVLL